jgi:hypothetical protein
MRTAVMFGTSGASRRCAALVSLLTVAPVPMQPLSVLIRRGVIRRLGRQDLTGQ